MGVGTSFFFGRYIIAAKSKVIAAQTESPEARRAEVGKGGVTYGHCPRFPAATFRPNSMKDSSAVDPSDATVPMMQGGRKASDRGFFWITFLSRVNIFRC